MSQRFKVGETDISIEITSHRPFTKGFLRGHFTVIEFSPFYPLGRKTFDCAYFEKEGRTWFNYPSKEVKMPNEEKPKHIPYISFADKAFEKVYNEAVTKALKSINAVSGENHDNNTAGDWQARNIQPETSSGMPF